MCILMSHPSTNKFLVSCVLCWCQLYVWNLLKAIAFEGYLYAIVCFSGAECSEGAGSQICPSTRGARLEYHQQTREGRLQLQCCCFPVNLGLKFGLIPIGEENIFTPIQNIKKVSENPQSNNYFSVIFWKPMHFGNECIFF